MDNLITAVIAIGLLAAVAVMSANYSTDAIANWQAKMDATQIVGDAKNIADAWREYARANNGNPALTDYCWGDGNSDFVSNYMSRMPSPPKGAVSTSVTFYFPAAIKSYGTNGSGTTTGPNYSPADSVGAILRSPKVCVAIALLAGSGTATVKTAPFTGDFTAVTTRRPFDCVYLDSDSSGGPSQGDTMLFVYRIFDQNNFTYASRSACP